MENTGILINHSIIYYRGALCYLTSTAKDHAISGFSDGKLSCSMGILFIKYTRQNPQKALAYKTSCTSIVFLKRKTSSTSAVLLIASIKDGVSGNHKFINSLRTMERRKKIPENKNPAQQS